MALITCPECKKEISDSAKACPSCGYEFKPSQKQLCPKCNIEAVAVEREKAVTVGGIVAIFLFLMSLPILFFNLLIGLIVMILGIVIGAFSKEKYTAIICPKCKKVLSKLE